jgi:hypothetical protein
METEKNMLVENSTTSTISETIEQLLINKIKTAINCKIILLYYPVYVNTFALADIFEKNQLGKTPKFFNWPDIVPKDLLKTLQNEEPDIVYCFSSSDKEDIFRA